MSAFPVERKRPVALTVRHITREEAEVARWGNWRWLIVDADDPSRALFYQGMLGIPEGADYLIGAISQARRWERTRGYKLILSPEMQAFEAAKHGLEAAVKLLSRNRPERQARA